jgi:CheY-like chemotaxis protein
LEEPVDFDQLRACLATALHDKRVERRTEMREELEVHVSDRENIWRGKKPYNRPSCTTRPIAEAAALLCKNASDREMTMGAEPLRTPIEAPILFVKDYGGDVGLIGQMLQTSGLHLQQNSIADGEVLLQIRSGEDENASQAQTCLLLLDLRYRGQEKRQLLKAIGETSSLRAAPIVILVSSTEDFQAWGRINTKDYWQLSGFGRPVDLVIAIRSFLHVCIALTKLPPEGSKSDPGRGPECVARAGPALREKV